MITALHADASHALRAEAQTRKPTLGKSMGPVHAGTPNRVRTAGPPTAPDQKNVHVLAGTLRVVQQKQEPRLRSGMAAQRVAYDRRDIFLVPRCLISPPEHAMKWHDRGVWDPARLNLRLTARHQGGIGDCT